MTLIMFFYWCDSVKRWQNLVFEGPTKTTTTIEVGTIQSWNKAREFFFGPMLCTNGNLPRKGQVRTDPTIR